MPRIFDNITLQLLPTLRGTLEKSNRADFCVGYFNLRGWQSIADLVDVWNGNPQVCRVLVGMQRPPQEDIRALYRASFSEEELDESSRAPCMDNATAAHLKAEFAAHLKEQITLGIPTEKDEKGLRQLSQQLRAGKVVVKLFLPYRLHAKLYLLYRDDLNNPITGFVGSSNLTVSGLAQQGELNVDVLDNDACIKLQTWFEERWQDRWAINVSKDLADLIDTSWAREALIPPYHIYLNMVYHISSEARSGLTQFRLPARFEKELFDFQKSAVKVAARHIHRRGGVLIGDVVGLGKTMMATALARMLEDDLGYETLILCPKNLEPMWKSYRQNYGLRGEVLPISMVSKRLPDLKRYRLVLIDESHNLRNRDGRRYKAISDYIKASDAKVILLSATPYNKDKSDLSAQLRLFVEENANIGIRPENYLRAQKMSEADFERKHQCKVHSIAAIEKSEELDDWRELMRLYMVRRTRSFITEHYTQIDEQGRRFLQGVDGEKRYFPVRKPVSLTFTVDESNPEDRYARLYSPAVVDCINALHVPRYGLGLYLDSQAIQTASPAERKQLDNLGKAGKRLMGFCRTNLFKRLESSGFSFLQSIQRHILRNQIYLYALENGLDLPVGVLDAGLLDNARIDEDADGIEGEIEDLQDGMVEVSTDPHQQAQAIYTQYATQYRKRFKWMGSRFFKTVLTEHLQEDTQALAALLKTQGDWNPAQDHKLQAFLALIQNPEKHGKDKVLVFTQFADTARYLANEARKAGIAQLECATGASTPDPYDLACRFSPKSNGYKIEKTNKTHEIRVLICTDVLSEGQNLQDSAVVVNFDLPWAIIRLIQRAGRVDRIGQQAHEVRCYSFLPADGVERVIGLRHRIRSRLGENAEVVGTDEAFFGDEEIANEKQALNKIYTEQQGALDDLDEEVDLASYAWQIWKDATEDNPELARTIENLPPVVYATKEHPQNGALVYVKSPEGNDHLSYLDNDGNLVTESSFAILKIAACQPETPPLERNGNHHELVEKGLALAIWQEKNTGGGLGRANSPRRRSYERLKKYADQQMPTLLRDRVLECVVDDIYQRPLLETAADILNRLMRSGVNDEELANAAKTLREDGQLTYSDRDVKLREPQIVCSMGLLSLS